MYLFTLFSFIILPKFLLYELIKKCRTHLRDFFLINIKFIWATANTTNIHENVTLRPWLTNRQSINISVWKLFIDFLTQKHNYNYNLSHSHFFLYTNKKKTLYKMQCVYIGLDPWLDPWQEHKMAVVYLLILKQANGYFLVGFYTAFYSSTWTISKRKNPGWDVFFFSPIARISALGLIG